MLYELDIIITLLHLNKKNLLCITISLLNINIIIKIIKVFIYT